MNNELTIEKSNAVKAYKEADNKGKTLLTNLFGKEVFSEKITDRVKTFADALAIVGASHEVMSFLGSSGKDPDMVSHHAHAKLTIIAKALNEGWEPNWKDGNEPKYRPWFDMSSGSGLSFNAFTYSGSDASVGSCLCYKSRELAEYAGKQFIDIYTDWIIIK